VNVHRICALAAALALAVVAGGSDLGAQQNLRSVYVSVVNNAGEPVQDLGPSDFIVREDNVAREVLRVVPADEPMQIAVLVDTSQQARNNIAHIRQALPPFVTALTNPNDAGKRNQVAIIAFGDRPTIFTDYTTNTELLTKGINRIFAQQGSGAYLVDAIFEVSQGFKVREAERPVIVAIANEGRELSYRQYEQTLDRLRDSGAVLYAEMLGTPFSDLSDEGRNRTLVLDRGTAMSGGQVDQVLAPQGLTERLRRLANQLTHQYRVSYSRPQSLIPPEKITVATTRPDMAVRFAPAKAQQERP
jgi:VWFA-related protein